MGLPFFDLPFMGISFVFEDFDFAIHSPPPSVVFHYVVGGWECPSGDGGSTQNGESRASTTPTICIPGFTLRYGSVRARYLLTSTRTIVSPLKVGWEERFVYFRFLRLGLRRMR